MRVLFTCAPASGHFHPLVPYARALADAGHDVAFAAPAFFAPAMEGAGFRRFSAGLEQSFLDVYPQMRTMPGPERTAFARREGFADLYPKHLIPDLLALVATWPPDLIVREENAYGGCIAAECLGLPHASVDILAAGDPSWSNDLIAEPLNRHRVAHGLPPDPALAIAT